MTQVFHTALWAAIVIASPVLTAIAVLTCSSMCYAWRSPETMASTGFTRSQRRITHSFSVIVPIRDEAEHVVRATVDRLLSQGAAELQIVISVGFDDVDTLAVADRIAADHSAFVSVSVNHDRVRNKPRQLNTALNDCRGDVVGIFDAESLAAPGLLAEVDAVFADPGVDAVQGAVQLVNYRDSWYSLHNCLEYYFWFRSRLHLQARKGFIPLGGNTVFIRRHVLVDMGGYDAECLAEDCELGVRLSSAGKRIAVRYDAALATSEETPGSLGGLIRQRTRWDTGFMQVARKGLWRALPTRRLRILAGYTLAQPFLQAFTGLVIPVSVLAAVTGHAPLWVALVSFAPALPTLQMAAFQLAGLHEFGREFGFRIRLWDHVRLTVSTPVYQVVLAVAALRAVVRFRRGNFAWEKTSHTGSHLDLVPDVSPAGTRPGARTGATALSRSARLDQPFPVGGDVR